VTTARTVLGDVEVDELGTTYCHEHLFTLPPGDPSRAGYEDLLLDQTHLSARELEIFAAAGGRSVVEVTTSEYGRDPARMAQVSRSTGVNVVAATGHIMEDYWRGVEDIAGRTDAELVGELVRDLTEGFPEAPGVRAGIIKVGTALDGPTRDEQRMLRAAAEAQRETGAPITTHTTRGTAGLEQLRVFEAAGADLTRVCIGHQDHRLHAEDHLAIVRSGCFIGFDCISKEQYEPDSGRIEHIKKLLAAGHGDQICLSGDLARRSYQTAYGGGPGFSYILWRFVPWMWQEGVAHEDTDRMLVANPARLLGWAT
jgi:predicted metal-dependent phosphotriesterase family hydrolase